MYRGNIKSIRIILFLFSVPALLSCQPSHMLERTNSYAENLYLIDSYEIKRQNNLVVPKRSSFYIAIDENEKSAYVKKSLTKSLQTAFKYFFSTVLVAQQQESLETALISARRSNITYLLYPGLEVWDAKKNQWNPYSHEILPPVRTVKEQKGVLGAKSWKSGKTRAVTDSSQSDQLRLQLAVIDVASGLQLDSVRIYTRIGVFSDSSKRPLTAIEEPLMSLAGQLSGSNRQY